VVVGDHHSHLGTLPSRTAPPTLLALDERKMRRA
jgi:hypothetical protein